MPRSARLTSRSTTPRPRPHAMPQAEPNSAPLQHQSHTSGSHQQSGLQNPHHTDLPPPHRPLHPCPAPCIRARCPGDDAGLSCCKTKAPGPPGQDGLAPRTATVADRGGSTRLRLSCVLRCKTKASGRAAPRKQRESRPTCCATSGGTAQPCMRGIPLPCNINGCLRRCCGAAR